MFRLENVIVKDVFHIKNLAVTAPVSCVIGQSGSGKSTLLRLLNNLDDPTSGEIYYKDKSIYALDARELRKKVVMVPQRPVVFDGTIRDNLLIGMQFSEDEAVSDEVLDDILAILSLKYPLETDASDLSGGEQQRISLGRVLLMNRAEVFLLDEPTSALDDTTAEHVLRSFIDRAKKNNQQIIMVTHAQKVWETFADEVVHMDEYSSVLES